MSDYIEIKQDDKRIRLFKHKDCDKFDKQEKFRYWWESSFTRYAMLTVLSMCIYLCAAAIVFFIVSILV